MGTRSLNGQIVSEDLSETAVSDNNSQGLLNQIYKELKKMNIYNARSQNEEVTNEDIHSE